MLQTILYIHTPHGSGIITTSIIVNDKTKGTALDIGTHAIKYFLRKVLLGDVQSVERVAIMPRIFHSTHNSESHRFTRVSIDHAPRFSSFLCLWVFRSKELEDKLHTFLHSRSDTRASSQ